MLGYVAIVLHAHLPYVRHPEHERSLEERWLYEALWESYLPLVDMLDRLAAEGVPFRLTISVSPPLLAMLSDPLLRGRFEDHLHRLSALAAREEKRVAADAELGRVTTFYRRRLAAVSAHWKRIGGDLLGALAAHRDRGGVELITTSASHAYLPGLLPDPASIRAQLRIGRRAFRHRMSFDPLGLWLPECAFDPRFSGDLARAGVRYTVLDAHGLLLARPRPPLGVYSPILAPNGVAFFARDPGASREVWSREAGYPGDPEYREFYRDIGFDLPAGDLLAEVGPGGVRLMTGLKYHRITGSGSHKAPYRPALAHARTRVHAAHFIARREHTLAELPRLALPPPIAVAPYDAELFGHWWFEGPEFLEYVLRGLDASERNGRVAGITLGGYLERHPEAVVAEPAASSWGAGGYGEVWVGQNASALLWRTAHRTATQVEKALHLRRHAAAAAGRALDQAAMELLLLQSSDWAFMIHRGEMAAYAEARVREHAGRAARLAELALSERLTAEDVRFIDAIRSRTPFLSGLRGDPIRSAWDGWESDRSAI